KLPPSAAPVPAPPGGSPVRPHRTAAAPARPRSGRAPPAVASSGAGGRVLVGHRRPPPNSTPAPPAPAPPGPGRLPSHPGHDRPSSDTRARRSPPSPGHSYSVGDWLGRYRPPSSVGRSDRNGVFPLT